LRVVFGLVWLYTDEWPYTPPPRADTIWFEYKRLSLLTLKSHVLLYCLLS
jgi:hypothetical protein